MPRKREKPTNQFIERLKEKHHVQDIKDLLSFYPGLDYESLLRYANIIDGKHQSFESLLRNARALGMSADDLIIELLGKTG